MRKIRAKLSEPSPYQKQMALYELTELAKRDASIHRQAIPIFEQYLNHEHALTRSQAIRGIAVTRGLEEAKALWFALLQHPDAAFVRVALGELGRMGDAALLGPATALLHHPDVLVQRDALTALSGIRTTEALQVLAGCLQNAQLRPYAVEALSRTRDPRAIPLIEPWLHDPSPAWPVDNHGPMLSVGDVVKEGLVLLRDARLENR